jgi:hypothetical protein
MTLGLDSIIQQNAGSFSGTSGNATLPSATTAGSMIVLCSTVIGDTVQFWTVIPPSGFSEINGTRSGLASLAQPYLWIERGNAGGETSWTLTPEKDDVGTTREVVWAVFEIAGTGMDRLGADFGTGIGELPHGYVNTVNQAGTNTAVATRSTGTTLVPVCYDQLAIAVHAALSPSTTIPVISGHTNNFYEIAQVSIVGSTRALAMSVSVRPSLVLDAQEVTASVSPSSAMFASCALLYADGARYAPELQYLTGFEFGTATGITTGSALVQGSAPFDAAVGTPEVVTSHPRTGSYCLKLSSTAAAECLTLGASPGTLTVRVPTEKYALVCRDHVYFETSLPSADVELLSIEAGSLANGMTIWYRSASQKLGVKIGTGTEVLSDAVVAPDKWIGIDYRYDPRWTNHLCDWQVDYDTSEPTKPVAQAQAVGASTSIADITLKRYGWTTAKTATVFYDDVVVCKEWGAYPIGEVAVIPLRVDPAGTPTLSGTSTNFKTFTSNGGTLTTWSAVNTRAALADIPPTIGAAADGLTQVAVAASDYVDIPMETFTAAPDFVPRGVRWYIAGWAASTAVGTIGFTFMDTGTPNGRAIPAGDHNWDNVILAWICVMHNSPPDWGYYQPTQARVDALHLQVGFSTDATPDVGIHSVFCELAYTPARVETILDGEGGAFTVYARYDPHSAAIASLLGTTPPGTRGMTVNWTINGVDGSQYVAPNTTYEKLIGAVDISTVTSIGFIPDATV